MKITFEGDHEAVLTEMGAFLAHVTATGTAKPAPAASEEPSPAPKKRGRPKKVKAEPEAEAKPEAGEGSAPVTPEQADEVRQLMFDEAVGILKEISVNSPERRSEIRDIVTGFGVAKVAEIPLDKAQDLLALAEGMRDAA
jgi:hypothetical protein